MNKEIQVYKRGVEPDRIISKAIEAQVVDFCSDSKFSDNILLFIRNQRYDYLLVAYSLNNKKITIHGCLILIFVGKIPEIKWLCAKQSGKLLMDAILDILSGYNEIFVQSSPQAVNFYHKFGFEILEDVLKSGVDYSHVNDSLIKYRDNNSMVRDVKYIKKKK